MKIHHRLILGTFLRYLVYALVGALILFTLVDLLDHLGSLIDNQATPPQIARYYLFKAAWILDLVLPVSLLMATLFTVGSMARYLELTALFASGLSLLQVARSILVAAVLFTIGSLLWAEFVLPEANIRRWRVWEVEIHKKAETLRPTRQIAVTGPDGRLYYAQKYDPNTKEVTGLKVVTLDDAVVRERLDARRAVWDGQYWVLYDGIRRVFSGEREDITRFDELRARDLAITPDGLYRRRIRPENMNVRQLAAHRDVVEQTGGDATSVRVDIQYKLAFPLINLIVVFLGVVLASGPRKTTIASGFGLTLLIGAGYYLLTSLARSLGHSQVLSPVVAGWSGNAVYVVIAWILFVRARR